MLEEIIEEILEEGLLIPIIIIGVISSIIKRRKKAAQSAQTMQAHHVAAPAAKPKPAAKPHPYTPVQPTIAPVLAFGDVPGQAIAPTVHPHVTPDCDTHDAPGSLGVTSDEGKDPCHEEQLTHVRTVEAPASTDCVPAAMWSPDRMVNAVIMQEVLTRPCQRRRR